MVCARVAATQGEALAGAMSSLPPEILARRDQAKAWFEALQQRIFAELERSPAFARRMLAGMSRRLHGLVADVEAYTLHTGGQRVVGYLLKDGPASGATVRLSVSKRLVASRLNITPEYFSRVLHDLSTRRLVRVDGREIEILDADGLRAYEG